MLFIIGGIAAAVVATIAASSSSSSSYEEDDFDERKEEAEEEALAKRNKRIKKDIKQYKSRQVKRFADNYGVDIDFISQADVKNNNPFVGLTSAVMLFGTHNKYKIKVISVSDGEPNPIEILEEENKKLSQFIEQIKEMKDESLEEENEKLIHLLKQIKEMKNESLD